MVHDWGGAQRWLRSDLEAEPLREACARLGGHATCWRGANGQPVATPFHPLAPALERYHRRLKAELDPKGSSIRAGSTRHSETHGKTPMQTHFSEQALQQPPIREADRVLRSCVHCGFCNATCPTYRLLGDERDGPRGRIYLIKQMLENPDDAENVTAQTRLHLDRCLTCRNCETTCPSGVEYHKLLDIGRAEIERRVPRKPAERAQRYALRKMLVEPKRFRALLKLGRPSGRWCPPRSETSSQRHRWMPASAPITGAILARC